MNSSDATTEPSVTMSRKDKRDLIMVGAAVVVAIIVVAALMIPPSEEESPELAASLQPGFVSLPAGRTVQIVPKVDVRGHIPIGSSWSYEWHVNPYWLGVIDTPYLDFGRRLGEMDTPYLDFGRKDMPESADMAVNFTAGEFTGSGNVTCIVTCGDLLAVAVANITVESAVLAEASITPSDTQILLNRSSTFTVVVRDSIGERVSNFTAYWSASGPPGAEYTMELKTGESVEFLFRTLGNVTISASVVRGTEQISCNTSVEAIIVPPRTVDYSWYDMFNVPFGEWWEKRLSRWELGHYTWMTDTYPYLLEHSRGGGGIFDTYGGMRLNITGRNLTEVSMNERPEFLPLLGCERGGNAVIDWYMQYLTSEELHDRYSSFASSDDGWIVVLNGTATLDKQAAKGVLNISEEGYEDFDDWWDDNIASVSEGFSRWIVPDGILRIDVEDTYGTYFQLFTFGLNASKVGDKVVLKFDVVTWGMEVLMMKWLREAYLPTEWWFEDMRFRARIGPCLTDIDIDTAIPFAARASNSTQTGQSCWIWQGMLQGLVPYDHTGWPLSLYKSPYYLVNERYMDMGSWVLPWDPMPGGLPTVRTPGSFNLTTGERMRFEWPAGDVMFMMKPFDHNWTNYSANIVLGYSEPNQTDMPAGQYVLNLSARYIEFIGPFDFWTWSKNQTSHAYLVDKWQLFGLLPYGMPYLEFWAVS